MTQLQFRNKIKGIAEVVDHPWAAEAEGCPSWAAVEEDHPPQKRGEAVRPPLEMAVEDRPEREAAAPAAVVVAGEDRVDSSCAGEVLLVAVLVEVVVPRLQGEAE
jgi:hypothetical protein